MSDLQVFSWGEEIKGPAGTVKPFTMSNLPPEQQGGIDQALFHAMPAQHPLWNRYIVAAIHLRDLPGQAKPPYKEFPAATHEFMVMALDPDYSYEPPWHFLQPANVVAQVTCTSDEVVKTVIEMLFRGLVNGYAPVEDGGRSLSTWWKAMLTNTIEHVLTGEHMPPLE